MFIKKWKLLSTSAFKRRNVNRKKAIRHITDDLEIFSDDPVEEQVRTEYPVRSLLTRLSKNVRSQKSIHESISGFLINSAILKVH